MRFVRPILFMLFMACYFFALHAASSIVGAAVAQAPADSSAAIHGVTPSMVTSLFDANAIWLMAIYGVVHKYVPALKAVPNFIIPWINAIGYVLVGLAGNAVGVNVVHASVTATHPSVLMAGFNFGALISLGAPLIFGITNSAQAALIYDKVLKPALEIGLGWKKPAGAAPEPDEKPKAPTTVVAG